MAISIVDFKPDHLSGSDKPDFSAVSQTLGGEQQIRTMTNKKPKRLRRPFRIYDIMRRLEATGLPETEAIVRCRLEYYQAEREALPNDIEERITKIDLACMGVSSGDRPEVLLGLCITQPSEVFWPVVRMRWSTCEDTWAWREVALGMLRSHQATRPEVTPGVRRIWRGCSRSRVLGLSWTTDRAVATGFAAGHRVPVPNPVVAEATIDERGVFVAIDDRKEAEVVIDPEHLHDLIVHDLPVLLAIIASPGLASAQDKGMSEQPPAKQSAPVESTDASGHDVQAGRPKTAEKPKKQGAKKSSKKGSVETEKQ
jgi:hypothetical protein